MAARTVRISICAGTLDGAAGLTLAAHAFTADKGSYYAITDDVPHWPQSPSQLPTG